MAGVNKAIILGNLGKDPELKYAQSGKAVCRFSLAVNEKRGGEDVTEWFNIVCFDRTAEIAGEYLAKGRQVYIEGRLQTRKWEDKSGQERSMTEIVVNNLVLLGDNRGQTGKTGRSQPADGDPFAGDFGQPPADDSLPF